MRRSSEKQTAMSGEDFCGLIMLMFRDDTPVVLVCEGQTFLPVFSTIGLARGFMDEALPTCHEDSEKADQMKMKMITDGNLFLRSVVGVIRVALNPHLHPDGNVHWTEPSAPEEVPPHTPKEGAETNGN